MHLYRSHIVFADEIASHAPVVMEDEGQFRLADDAMSTREKLRDDVKLTPRQFYGNIISRDETHLSVQTQATVLHPLVRGLPCVSGC
jgi:hypothetical protein